MIIKVAVFGNEEIVRRIDNIIDGHHDIEIKPFIYTTEKETADLISKAFMCDTYLFTGALPYLYAKKEIDKNRLPNVQVAFDAYMVIASLYRMKNTYHRQLDRTSIDIPDKKVVDEVLKELNIVENDIYVYSFGDKDVTGIDHIVAYHQRLWNDGKIDYVLTAIKEVESRLQKLNIPTSTMNIPQRNIEHAIEKTKAVAKFNQSKSAQIVAGYLQIKNLDTIKAEDIQEVMLQLHQILLTFASKTASSIIQNNHHQFVLMGTRSLLNHIRNHYRDFPLLHEIETALNASLEIGIGLGLTTDLALEHAKMALEICGEREEGNCYVVNERQHTIGPLGVEKQFDRSALYQSLIHKARLNNELSYNFIDFINIRNNEPFSSNDIATYYNITKRSAERTINKLLAGGVIRITGEERPYLRGRPRKLFTVNQ